MEILQFLVTLVCWTSFAQANFHAKVILRKDGSVDIPNFEHANFNSTCEKNKLCTFSLNAPAFPKDLFQAIDNNQTHDSEALATAQSALSVENSTWYTFLEGTFGKSYDELETTLQEIEEKIRNASALMDQVEAAIQTSTSKLTPIQNSLNAAPQCYANAWAKCQRTTTAATTTSGPTTFENTASGVTSAPSESSTTSDTSSDTTTSGSSASDTTLTTRSGSETTESSDTTLATTHNTTVPESSPSSLTTEGDTNTTTTGSTPAASG
uniref:Uncharacterized protein n=1 Tax=Panagrolaimus sp. JU765 TaxID=591449 RepID=A0AC34R4C0_9BILA